ncbi:MAG TPA: PAS and ANTAR domain-containing protein [Microlunatus sp.]|nr:PAS and ANTAR domain-containing protein [Microlunatus sp.]
MLQYFVASQREGIGQFVVDPDTDRWRWSRSLYDMFGHTPETFTPSWEAILGHVPESERALVEESYRRACTADGPFSWSHRIRTCAGLILSVIVIGDSTTVCANPREVAAGPSPARRCLRGFVMDVTELRSGGAHAAADDAVQRSREHQATIEQAKGALMLAYRLTPDAAFELLRWHSSRANRKLHLVAADLLDAVQQADLGTTSLRTTIDIILTGEAGRG